jgi:hypothetical protein
MAITFKCPRCASELTVGDTLAGSQGKCPRCFEIVSIPTRSQQERSPPSFDIPPVRPILLDESELERPSRRRRYRDEDDRPRRRYRDDDRPRRLRSRDEDELEEIEDDPERRASAREERKAWTAVARGIGLSAVGMWLYVGAWGGLLALMFCSSVLTAERAAGPSIRSMGLITNIFFTVLVSSQWVLSIVGACFALKAPESGGGRGLTATALILGSLCLLLNLVAFFVNGYATFKSDGETPILGLVMIILIFVMEAVRTTFLAAFVYTVARTLRDSRLSSSASNLVVATPVVSGIVGLLSLLLWVVLSNQVPRVSISIISLLVIVLVNSIAFIILACFHAVVYRALHNSIEDYY